MNIVNIGCRKLNTYTRTFVIILPIHGRGSLFQLNEYLPVWSNKGYIHVISIVMIESVVTCISQYKNMEGYETPIDAFITPQVLSSPLSRNSCLCYLNFN